jgi:hypothetical protein
MQVIAVETSNWRQRIDALLARLRRRSTIHVADISEDWLAEHATETPKHTDDH